MSGNSNSSDVGAFLAGFVIGGLVGAAAALILAPQSGSETRRQLMQRGEDLRGRAEQYGGEYREKATGYISDARTRAQEAGSQVQERVGIVLDEGREKLTSTKKQISDTARISEEESTGEDASETQ